MAEKKGITLGVAIGSGLGIGVALWILFILLFATGTQTADTMGNSFFGFLALGLIGGFVFFGIAHEKAIEGAKKFVPANSIVVRDSGEVLTAGERYTPQPYDEQIPLGPRIIQAEHAAGTHGISDYLYMQATYKCDLNNVPQFVRVWKEAGGYKELDSKVTKMVSGKLCMSREPDFSDLDFSNIEEAFGIVVTNRQARPRQAPEKERERLTGFERYVKGEMAKVDTLRAGIVWIADEIKKAEQEKDPQVRQFMLDILQNAAERLKTSS